MTSNPVNDYSLNPHLLSDSPSTDYCSLANLFRASRSSEHLVVVKPDLTWQTFKTDVAALTQTLSQSDVSSVALCCQDTYWFTVSFFAACHAGKTVVLPSNYQPAALAELCNYFDLLLTDTDLRAPQPCPTIEIGANRPDAPADNDNASLSDALGFLDIDHINLILFTSGSSGTPKAIQKTLRQLDSEVANLEKLWGKTLTGSTIESSVSHQHIYGLLFRILWPLCSGRPFARHNLEYPEQIIAHIDQDVTFISSPALLKRLDQTFTAKPARAIFSSGGPLSVQAATLTFKIFTQFPYEIYGSTETGGIAYRQQNQAPALWQMFPGIAAQRDSEGCLRIRSPYIDSALWYPTADQCTLHSESQFELQGRADLIVKIEEKRISLVEVEKRLEQLEWIKECVAISQTLNDRQTLAAAIVLTESGEQKLLYLGKRKFWLLLRNHLRHWLEPVAIPRRFRVVQEIPLNSQGKRQMATIQQLFQV